MGAIARMVAVVAAAVGAAAILGVGVPMGWVWVASQVDTSVGQGASDVAALVVIVGPLASYIALIAVAGRFAQPRDPARRRMPWNRSRDEAREDARRSTTFEQVIVLAIFIVAGAFEVWFFFFAHQRVWGS